MLAWRLTWERGATSKVRHVCAPRLQLQMSATRSSLCALGDGHVAHGLFRLSVIGCNDSVDGRAMLFAGANTDQTKKLAM